MGPAGNHEPAGSLNKTRQFDGGLSQRALVRLNAGAAPGFGPQPLARIRGCAESRFHGLFGARWKPRPMDWSEGPLGCGVQEETQQLGAAEQNGLWI